MTSTAPSHRQACDRDRKRQALRSVPTSKKVGALKEVGRLNGCAHFANVLRAAEVTPKSPRRTSLRQMEQKCAFRPHDQWQSIFAGTIEVFRSWASEEGTSSLEVRALTQNVIRALRGWVAIYCRAQGIPMIPNGCGNTRLASARTVGSKGFGEERHQIPINRDTYREIKLVMRSVLLASAADVRLGVIFFFCRKKILEGEGSWTRSRIRLHEKTGAQLVGASRGSMIFASTLMQKLQGPAVFAACIARRIFRDGILLSVAVALPQRARAISQRLAIRAAT